MLSSHRGHLASWHFMTHLLCVHVNKQPSPAFGWLLVESGVSRFLLQALPVRFHRSYEPPKWYSWCGMHTITPLLVPGGTTRSRVRYAGRCGSETENGYVRSSCRSRQFPMDTCAPLKGAFQILKSHTKHVILMSVKLSGIDRCSWMKEEPVVWAYSLQSSTITTTKPCKATSL